MISVGRGTLLGMGYIRITADTAQAEGALGLLGKAAIGTVGAVAAIGITTTVMAANFNREMLKIQTQAGGTSKDVKTLTSDVLNMKGAQQGPDQLAAALYHLKSIGLDNASAMKDLRVSSDLAAVGGSNLEATTNALGGAWRSGIKGAETFAASAATVNAVIGAGNMRMEDFVAAIGTGILPAAKTFGVSLGSIGSALALMTDEGIPAVDAATRLKMSLSLLAAPSQVASKQLAMIGLTGLQLANEMRSPAGLVGAIGMLKQHLDASGLSLSQQAILLSHAFGGGRSSSAILTMINNYDVLVKKQDQVNSSLGKFSDAVAAQRATVSAQFKILQASLEDIAIRIGEVLIPPATKFITFLNSTAIPGIVAFTGYLYRMVPVDKIRSDFAVVAGMVTALVHGAGSIFAGPAKALAAVHMPLTPTQPAAYRLQVPGFTSTVRAPGTSAAYGSQVPGFSTAVTPAFPFVSRSAAYQSQVPVAPGRTASPFLQQFHAPVIKPPDVSGWTRAGQEIGKVLSTIRSVAEMTLPPIGRAFTTLADGVMRIVLPAFNIISTFVTASLVPSLRNIAVFVAPLLGLLQPLAALIGGALFLAFQAVGFILNSVIGPALKAVTGFLAENKTLVISLGIVFGVFTAGLLLLNGGLVVLRLQLVALAVQQFAVGVATKGLAIAQAALNLVMDANPIGLVIVALAALAAGFYYAWTHSATFRNIVMDTFNGIKVVALDVFHFLTTGLGQFTLLLLGPIGVLLLLAVHWRGTWTVMKDVALAVGSWFAGPFVGFFVGVGAWFSGPFVGFFVGIGHWFSGPFVGFFMGVGHWFSHDFVGFFMDMWHLIEGVLRFLVDGFLSVASAIIRTAEHMFGWVPGVGGKLKSVAKTFDAFRDSVNASLGGIQPKTVPVTVSFNGVNQNSITAHSFTSTTGFTYARGGEIPEWLGIPNKDSVPILAMGGEFVVNKQSTAKHRKLLEAINANDVKTYASGGMVGFTHAVTADMARAAHIDVSDEVKKIASAYAHAYNTSAYPRGLSWARTQMGMPYQWGGNGNPSWDCATLDSVITTPQGSRKLADISAGDSVIAVQDDKLVVSKVLVKWCTGTQEVYKVRTRNRELRVTPGHRVLAAVQHSALPGAKPTIFDAWTTEWKHVRDLTEDDFLVTYVGHDAGGGEDYPADLAWLLGLWVADGSLHPSGNLRFCVYGDLAEKVQKIWSTYYPDRKSTHSPRHGVMISHKGFTDWMAENGFQGKSHERTVPPVVGTWTRAAQDAFLEGYADGDGCYRGSGRKQVGDFHNATEIVYTASSRELLEGIRELHIQRGDRASILRDHSRGSGPIIIGGVQVKNARPMYRFEVGPGKGVDQRTGAGNRPGLTRLAERLKTEGLSVQRVLSVEPDGIEETWDIEVEGSHSFVSDGLVSHNCSGLMSAIESVIRGEAPHRRWATGAFSGSTAPPNWVLNAQSPFMIGVTNAGVGHTAGTLLGTNVEMTVPVARMGPGARGASDAMFPDRYGLVGFDRGGWLKPGLTHVWNGTGRPERVPDPTAGHGGELHIHLHNHGAIGSRREMEDWLSASLDELKRKGRLRNLIPGAG